MSKKWIGKTRRSKRYKPRHQKEEVKDEEEAEAAMMVDTQIRNLKILILKGEEKAMTITTIIQRLPSQSQQTNQELNAIGVASLATTSPSAVLI